MWQQAIFWQALDLYCHAAHSVLALAEPPDLVLPERGSTNEQIKMTNDAFGNIRPTKLNFYLRCMEKFGFSSEDVLSGTGMTKTALENPRLLIETSDYIRVVSNMLKLTNSPELPFRLGKELRPGDLGLLGHTISASSNLAEATALWLKYNWLFFGNLFSVVETYQNGLFLYEYRPRIRLLPGLLQFFVEEMINVDTYLFSRFNNCSVPGKKFYVTYPAPRHKKLYQDLLGASATFNSDKIRFSVNFTDPFFNEPLPGSDQETLIICKSHLEEITHRANVHTSLSAKTRHLIGENLPNVLSAEEIAKNFGCSLRTFTRRLQREDTNYLRLIANTREKMAKNYLLTTSLTVDQIAAFLGFNDTSNFRRAFKMWCGMTISQFRELGSNALEKQHMKHR